MFNARFWIYCNGGPVKLTLKPGQTLEHCEGGRTEEGYDWTSTTWTHAGDEPCVYREWHREAIDCDGRLSTGGADCCGILELASGNEPYIGDDDPAIWHGVRWPNWHGHTAEPVYDEYAQSMGY